MFQIHMYKLIARYLDIAIFLALKQDIASGEIGTDFYWDNGSFHQLRLLDRWCALGRRSL